MNEIKITEENYEVYKEFDRLKDRTFGLFQVPVANKKVEVRGNVLTSTVALISFMAAIGMSIIASGLYFPIALSITIYLTIFTAMIAAIGGGLLFVSKIIDKMNMKEFKKQHPDFDINIDIKEAAKALEKYKKLSKVPKNIEEKKKEHLTNLPDQVKKMSTQEKLTYLGQEKEFWEQVAIQEKYEKTEEKETQIQKRK